MLLVSKTKIWGYNHAFFRDNKASIWGKKKPYIALYFTSSETQGQSVGGGRNGATKVFKNGRKNPWVPSLTGPFPNGFAFLPNQEPLFAKPFGNGPVRLGTQGFFRPFLKTFVAPFRPPPTDCPWVSEDVYFTIFQNNCCFIISKKCVATPNFFFWISTALAKI